jgi:hypothetical protein
MRRPPYLSCATAVVRAPALARVNAERNRVSAKHLRSILALTSNASGTQFHQNGSLLRADRKLPVPRVRQIRREAAVAKP